MKLRLLYAALTGVFFLGFANGNSQDLANPLMPVQAKQPFYIGPIFGINLVDHTTDIRSIDADLDPQSLCPVLSDGSGTGFYAGISFEYFLEGSKDSKSSIIAKLYYSTLPSSFQQNWDNLPSVIDAGTANEQIVFSSTEFTSEVVYNVVSLELLYKLNLFETTFGVVAGPTFDMVMASNYNRKMNLLQPLNAQFVRQDGYEYENDDRTVVLNDGEIDGASGLRIGLKVGAQYELLIGTGYYIVPNVGYNFGVTEVTGVQNWRVNAIQMGVDIRFAL